MATVKDIRADTFIAKLAEHLEKSGKFPAPKNADIIKLSRANELAPLDEKWYFVRLAAVFRKVYIYNGVGVGALARAFGGSGRTRNLIAPGQQMDAARGNIRYALQQLQKAGFVAIKKNKAGRFITDAGRRELDQIAKALKA